VTFAGASGENDFHLAQLIRPWLGKKDEIGKWKTVEMSEKLTIGKFIFVWNFKYIRDRLSIVINPYVLGFLNNPAIFEKYKYYSRVPLIC
jgi:hypothetical protein